METTEQREGTQIEKKDRKNGKVKRWKKPC